MNEQERRQVHLALKMGRNDEKDYWFREIMLEPDGQFIPEKSKFILYARYDPKKKQTNFWTLPELPREAVESIVGEVILFRAHEKNLVNVHEIDVNSPTEVTLDNVTYSAQLSARPPQERTDDDKGPAQAGKEGAGGSGGEREKGGRSAPVKPVLVERRLPLILKPDEILILEMNEKKIIYLVNDNHRLEVKTTMFTETTKPTGNLDEWMG